MKKLLFLLCVTVLVFSFHPIYAVGTATKSGIEKRAEITANVMTRLKEKANKEIDRRIASLTKLIEKINAVKRLTASQKSTMVSQVQAEIDSLNALRTTIAGQTDIAALRTSVQSIVKSYRIYALYIPKMTIIANADKILNLIEGEMATLTIKLQSRITEASAKGFDVASMNSLMSQREAKLDEATTLANGAITKVTALTPDGWTGDKTVLQSARDLLQTARKDLNDAQKFASQVRVQLVQLKPTGMPKPTSTVAPTP